MKKTTLIISIAVAILSSCGTSKKGGESCQSLSGAGATFPLPYYNMVFEQFNNTTEHKVSYGGIGSGGGIRSLKNEIVDFAGSDAFLSDKDMSEMKDVLHIPTCLGAVVLAYNLPGINDVNLTGSMVADIFMGKIQKWNDPHIQDINQGIELPDLDITPVYRSDGSGTTFVFTDYLSKISEEWKSQIGNGKSVDFPKGIAAKGNPGVAGTISQTEGTIGYVGSEYAFAQQIKIASLESFSGSGNFIKPSSKSISMAAQRDDIPQDTRVMLTNSQVDGSYPISCFTWILVYKDQNYAGRSIEKAKTTIQLLKYVLSDEAQALTTKIHYTPIPNNVREMALKAIDKITYDNKPVQ